MKTIPSKFALALTASLALSSVAHAQAPAAADPSRPAGWYGAIALGSVYRASDASATLNLGGTPAVVLDGKTGFGRGQSLGLSAGWQSRPEPAAGQPVAWRVEGELLSASIKRKSFQAGVLQAGLGDSLQASGLFVNGLIRLAATPLTQWWLGAGVGLARVSLPDAGSAAPGCGCLASASGSGSALRLKAQGEWMVSGNSALFAELGYLKLPEASTAAGTLPKVAHGATNASTLALGFRAGF